MQERYVNIFLLWYCVMNATILAMHYENNHTTDITSMQNNRDVVIQMLESPTIKTLPIEINWQIFIFSLDVSSPEALLDSLKRLFHNRHICKSIALFLNKESISKILQCRLQMSDIELCCLRNKSRETILHCIAKSPDLECSCFTPIEKLFKHYMYILSGKYPEEYSINPALLTAVVINASESCIHNLVLARNVEKKTALHEASYHGHAGVVYVLLEAPNTDGASFALMIDKENYTALHHAAIKNQAHVVRLLLSQSYADLLIGKRDKDGSTALHVAAWYDNYESIKEIIESKNLDAYHVANIEDRYNRKAYDIAYRFSIFSSEKQKIIAQLLEPITDRS